MTEGSVWTIMPMPFFSSLLVKLRVNMPGPGTEGQIPPMFYRTSSPLGLQLKSDKNLISLLYLMNLKTFLIGVLYSSDIN